MKFRKSLFVLLITAVLFLTGCNMRTINEMYCLPQRSDDYLNLQSAIDSAMTDLQYCAPISGEHQQPVQTADLDGDGAEEYLVFAKGSGDKPLKLLVFDFVEGKYVLTDRLEGSGTAFVQVQYAKISGRTGYDLVLSKQVSNQVVRTVSVYSMADGKMEQKLTTNCSQFVCTDLDGDTNSELLVLRPGEHPVKNGVAELYTIRNGEVERSNEVTMSEPSDSIKRIMISPLNDGLPAVFVASDIDGSAIITDVYALPNGVFTNVSLSSESGTSVQTLRNYYVFAEDIDHDGILELPHLIPMTSTEPTQTNQYLIRWYAMNSDGSEVDKLYSYHNYVGGWYLTMNNKVAADISITPMGNSYEFTVTQSDGSSSCLMTIYVFTGLQREEQAVSDNRFVLHRTESTVYAAHLEVVSAAYGITQESMKNAFHMIAQDWKVGET